MASVCADEAAARADAMSSVCKLMRLQRARMQTELRTPPAVGRKQVHWCCESAPLSWLGRLWQGHGVDRRDWVRARAQSS